LNTGKTEQSTVSETPKACEGRIIVVNEERAAQGAIERLLTPIGFQVDLGLTVDEGLTLLKTASIDLVIVDIGLPEGNGFDALNTFREVNPQIPIVVTMPAANNELASDCLSKGAYECLVLNDSDGLVSTARAAVKLRRFNRENLRMLRVVEEARTSGVPLGHSKAFRDLEAQVHVVSRHMDPVILVGEVGTGKKLIARHLHDLSDQHAELYLSRHSSTVTVEEVEGFFSGVGGYSGGTLFLEDIEELPSRLQMLLTDLIQNHQEHKKHRVVASTHESIPLRVNEGRFHDNLWELLRRNTIEVPPLRARREDITLLATWFLEQAAGTKPHKGLALDALMILEVLPWPGNLRELKQAVEQAWVISNGDTIRREHIVGPGGSVHVNDLSNEMAGDGYLARKLAGVPPTEADVLPFEEEERRILDQALQATDGNVTKAAQLLRIGRATLYRKIHQYGLRD